MSAETYILDSQEKNYSNYRSQLIAEATKDPVIKKRLRNASSIAEMNNILENAIKKKLDIYKKEHGIE